jgi:hypothetical protein
MIKSLFRRLFFSEEKENQLIKELMENPFFQTKEEMGNNKTYSKPIEGLVLEKGEVQSVSMPDLGNQKGFVLAKHYFKEGDVIKVGDVICDLENENFTFEFESYFAGQIVYCCELNVKMSKGTLILKLEGI